MKTARFGEFELDFAAGELRRGDTRLRLSRQPVEVLTALLERPGQVVTREELRARLWHEDTFVDFEHGLNAAVNRLREALGDSAQAPRFVETLPGRGYRFLPHVEVPPEPKPAAVMAAVAHQPDAVAVGSGDGVPAAQMARGPVADRWRGWLPWIVALVAGSVAVALWLAGRPGPSPDEPVRFVVTLPPGARLEGSPVGSVIAISPDGRQVAFVAAAAGRVTRLWVRSLDALAAQPLEGTENAVSPFWSPDGRFLAFFSEGRLRKVAVQGGSPETLCETGFATSGTWNAEGTILFSQFTGPKAGLWRISASGGAPERVRTGAGAIESWPQFLPDGRHFLFLTGAYHGTPGLLHAGSLDAPASQRLIAVDSRATYVAGGRVIFARDGALMTVPFDASQRTIGGEATPLGETVSYLRTTGSAFFSASPDGRALVYVPLAAPTQLTWLDRTGRPAGTVGEPSRIFGVRLSPDGKKAAAHIFDVRKGARDIWVDDLVRGVRSRLTADPVDALFPVWDPRGERIAYGSARRGPPQLYVRSAEAAGEERLLLDVPGVRFPRDWSPDGGSIVIEDYSPDRRVRFQLWILALGPPPRLLPFAHGPANKYDARFSPDGRHLAFTSEETGRPEVFVASLDGATQRQVSSEGGFQPRWRGDGQELFYLTPHGELVSVSVTPGLHLAVGGRRPLFSLGVGTSGVIPQAGPLNGPDYDVTADGQRFLVNLGAESAQGSFVVLLGWQRTLKP
jgi:Tol biopolymer transport system component/DNA-binding winged helix-turn-helix (wHTH) protein